MAKKESEEYARFCLETNHAGTIEIGNMTFADSVAEAKRGIESGEYYDFDYFTWDDEKIDLNSNIKLGSMILKDK